MEKSGKTNSPFRYPGGKFYARKLILACIPEHNKYCEPFVGGGSIFFAKTTCNINILNDKDEELINCYIHIRDYVEDLIKSLAGLEATKEIHKYMKNEFKPSNDLERAKRWFYLNRTSYSGIMKQQNCYWGYGEKYSMRPENWPRHLRTVSDRLQGIKFTCCDFEQVIDELSDDFFLFIDPPYFNADQDKFYQCSFLKEDHFRLNEVLKRNQKRLRFLITYDNSIEIKELYSWCTSHLDKEWNYTINRTDDQRTGKKLKDGHKSDRYKGKEVFITNYDTELIKGIELLKRIEQKEIQPKIRSSELEIAT